MPGDMTVPCGDGLINIRVGAIIMKDGKLLMAGNRRVDYLYTIGGRVQFGETAEDPIQRLKDKDKKRKAYYQLYSDRKWGAMENYHVALDSGALGLERCAEILVQLF